MGREERPLTEWSSLNQNRGGSARATGPVVSVVVGILRWLWWIFVILLLPIILPTVWITLLIVIVLYSPLIVFTSKKRGTSYWRTVGGLLMLPIEQRALVAPPRTYFFSRMFRSAARKW